MVSLSLLPDELLLAILTQAASVRSVKRALRLRLVCKRFANLATTAIFNSGVLDCEDISRGRQTHRAPHFWAEYLADRTLMRARRKYQHIKTLLLVAQHICRYRHAAADETCVTTGTVTDDEFGGCVRELCKMLTMPYMSVPFHIEKWLVCESTDVAEGEVDESSPHFKRLVLSAAAWMGEKNIVAKLVGEGCNLFYDDGPSLFLCPLAAASYRGHVDIVKLMLADDSCEAPHISSRACSIVIYAMRNNHTELLDLVLDPPWHRGQLTPRDIRELRLLALSETSDLETFIRLLRDAKPHIADYELRWLPTRIDLAAKQGQADIVKYLIANEGADVNIDNPDNSSIQSRHPAELNLRRRWAFTWGRANSLISRAARAGHVDVVKVLLDAGAEHRHAIEFAAACGSRTIMRLLWEHGENKDDAVQGAFVMAVDREDTAMFNLLEEVGAKLADDVRAAAIKRAQEEGLESMVKLLSKDANASSKGAS